MTDHELIEQFKRCEQWQNYEQWELLAVEYCHRGYLLNALHCFKRADMCRMSVVEMAGE